MDIVRTKVYPLIREILDVHPFIPWIYRRFDVHPLYINHGFFMDCPMSSAFHWFHWDGPPRPRPRRGPSAGSCRRAGPSPWFFNVGPVKSWTSPGNRLQTPKNLWSICVYMDLPEKGKEMILMSCDFMMGKLVICAGYPGYSYSRWGYKPSYWGFQSYQHVLEDNHRGLGVKDSPNQWHPIPSNGFKHPYHTCWHCT